MHPSRRSKCTTVITRCPSLLIFHIFDFFSATAEQNSTKLARKQDLNVCYHFCVFRADRKTKMATLPSHWLRYFRLLFCKRWTEINETWGNKMLISSTKCVLFRPIRLARWPLQPLIGWDIFYFFSATAEWNSTKLDRKQVLNVLHQVCV